MFSDSSARRFIADYWKKIDTVLMGRKTYEAALRQSKGNSSPYPGMQSYVLSRTLTATKDDPFEIPRDAVKLLRKLKRERARRSASWAEVNSADVSWKPA